MRRPQPAPIAPIATEPGQALLEREQHRIVLTEALAAATGGHGVLVLIKGEAGSGKTSLVRDLQSRSDHVLWGACDPLFTPRTLGPFADMARQTGGDLRDAVSAAARADRIAEILSNEASRHRGTLIVLEDLHWADEATLDVLSMLGRRIDALGALVVATFRDDELDRKHPLVVLLGELARQPSVQWLTTLALSPAAVRTLAEPYGVDPTELYRISGGNPFFLTEVLAAGGEAIPPTVRDAVRARLARLPDGAREVLDAVSVALPLAEPWLLATLCPDSADAVEACLSAGVLTAASGGLGFRHELARLAVAESLSPHRSYRLHRDILKALSDRADTTDPARLAYHAEAAGDPDAVHRFGLIAAQRAASGGAHREAAAQFERVLRSGGGLTAAQRADLLERRAQECHLSDDMDAARQAATESIRQWRAAGERRREGAGYSLLARHLWCGGRIAEAAAAAETGVRLLESGPPSRELALAYGSMGQIHMNDEQFDQTVSWSKRALDLAETIGDVDLAVHSLNNIGTIQLLNGVPEGMGNLQRSIELARQAGREDDIGRGYIHLGWAATRTRSYELLPLLDRGAAECASLGLIAWELYVLAYRAKLHLDLGDWDAARSDATVVLRSANTIPLLRILALTVQGLVAVRRGEPGGQSSLDEAAALLDGQNHLQAHLPVATARAEVAWLAGRNGEVEGATRTALDLAIVRGASWAIGELAWLRRLSGIDEPVPSAQGPYRLQIEGACSAAATWWNSLGCRYDAALALAGAAAEGDQRRALAEFQQLGARPAATVVARALRERGLRNLPRGPQAHTVRNPAQLTRRQTEVLGLVTEGLSNAEIAVRMYLSEKTVQHHVSAVFRKLGVASRSQAFAEAVRLGLAAGLPK